MAKATSSATKKVLPKNLEQLLEKRTKLSTLQAVFETCDINARGGYSKGTALMMSDCSDELARWLVARGIDVAATDQYGQTALHHRARIYDGNVALLIELGCDVAARNGDGDTPLHVAASAALVEIAKVLLAHGAKVSVKNRNGLTPLEVALQSCTNSVLDRTAPVVRVLLDAGAKPTPATKQFVKQIGKSFEFYSTGVDRKRDPSWAALNELYQTFGVTPVARREMHDGKSLIKPKARTWEKQHVELWKLLVPPSGPATTIQGEVIRISGRIGDEIERNGGGNWDKHHDAMAKAFLADMRSGTPLPAADIKDCAAIVASLVKRKDADYDRLSELAVAWVLRNPKPTPLGKVRYSR